MTSTRRVGQGVLQQILRGPKKASNLVIHRNMSTHLLGERSTLGYSSRIAKPMGSRREFVVKDGSHDKFFNRPGPWDEKDLGSLMQANKNWANRMREQHPDFFRELKKGHAPKILWIGCSDARVPANEIIGEPPGSVFIHRNIANQVINTDFNCMSVIQYAVSVLKVKHIIVCGHYDCGGVKASLEPNDHRSPLINWLRNVRDTYRLHREELNAFSDLRSRQRRLVELNVIEQCVNVMKTAVVQRARVQTRKLKNVEGAGVTFTQPRVHGMVYEPTTGEAKFLDLDFHKLMENLKDIYDLYRPPDGDKCGGGMS